MASNNDSSVTERLIVKGTIGTIPEYNLKEDWENWSERLELYFLANEVDNSKKVAILLTSIGMDGYSLLKDLSTPEKPSSKTYEELVNLMSTHLQPKPSEITERYKFKERLQHENESVHQFIANLKKLSVNCNFGNNLESVLRDQIVWGVRNNNIKKRLLSETDLTYKKCVELAVSMEATMREVSELAAGTSKINLVKNRYQRPTQNAQRNQPIQQHQPSHGQQRNQQRSQPYNGQRSQTSDHQNSKMKTCFCCGKGNHISKDCYYRNFTCNFCGKVGHLKKVCKALNSNNSRPNPSFKNKQQTNVKYVSNTETSRPMVHDDKPSNELNKSTSISTITVDDLEMDDTLFHINSRPEINPNMINRIKPIFVNIIVEDHPVSFELDTGSGITAMNLKDFKTNFKNVPLKKTEEEFLSYSGETITPIGIANVKCKRLKERDAIELPLYVINTNKNRPNFNTPPILGRLWLSKLKMNIQFDENNVQIKNVISADSKNVDNVLMKFPQVFSNTLGTYNKLKCKLSLKENSKPIFFKPRQIPYALKEKVEKEIDRLISEKIVTPVHTSDWGTPVVPILKPDGTIRLCGDYKVTVNPNLNVDRHPIPRVEELFNALRGGQKFSKLDLSQAYMQIELDENSKKLTTISTHKGLFVYNRLPYGIASGPGIFQREIENVLRDVNNVVCFLDDIVVTGENDEAHLKNLTTVLTRLNACGFTVKRSKCSFLQENISFLGHKIDKYGLHMSEEKVQAVVNAKTPTNVTELQAYLGLINYYSKFLPNVSTILMPLYEMLHKNVKWNWTERKQEAFVNSKKLLLSAKLLVHFDPNKEVILACDASPYGIGGVISHNDIDGKDKPIAYVSKTLSQAEKGYSQLHREALAIVYSIKHFHQYLYGRKFILKTDCKPLTTIFGSKTGIPQMTANRLQRWAIFLNEYDFKIQYVKSKDNCNADGLSRLPQPSSETDVNSVKSSYKKSLNSSYEYLNFVKDNVPCLNYFDVQKETAKDVVLSQVVQYCLNGWPTNTNNTELNEKIKPYKNRASELYVDRQCLMLGNRIVVPLSLRELILTELHASHLGIVKMKAIARSYVWWPKLDDEIEKLAKSCTLCLQNKDNPPRTTYVWKWPAKPGQRVHIDHLGPIHGKVYLLITDAYSKWVDVVETPKLTSECTIEALRVYFANFGIPLVLVSDNGTSFTSEEFTKFTSRNGITHIKTAPYHPSSNGAAENLVKTFKSKFKILLNEMPTKQAVSRFLLDYRNAPHCTTGVSPAELHLGRKLRTRLDRIKPSVALGQRMETKQSNYIVNPRSRKNTTFNIDEIVFVKKYDKGNSSWTKAKVVEQLSPVTFMVKTSDGFLWKRHMNQIQSCNQHLMTDQLDLTGESTLNPNTDKIFKELLIVPKGNDVEKHTNSDLNNSFQNNSHVTMSPKLPNTKDSIGGTEKTKTPILLRRSSRVVKPRKLIDL